MLEVIESGQACGATITGVDLSEALSADVVEELRAIWLKYLVVSFPEQKLSDEDLVRLTKSFGSVGDDPYFLPIHEKGHVVALTRRADEKAPVFAENWHTDWSFKSNPPIGTCLYSLVIPPVGGDTSFVNQHLALQKMPVALRQRLEGKIALHSAAGAYAPDGFYGNGKESETDRSMKIVTDESARDVNVHPLIVAHPETGEETLFGTAGYIIGFEGLEAHESQELVAALYEWQTREEFQYTHKWEANMFVMWDNRSVLHKANGGYDGYDRELHRTTIAGVPGLYVA